MLDYMHGISFWGFAFLWTSSCIISVRQLPSHLDGDLAYPTADAV